MKKIYEKYILLSVLLLTTVALASYISSLFTSVYALAGGCAVLALGIVGSFRLLDRFYPTPENLTVGEVKSFFSSKIFWLGFFFIIFNGLLPNMSLSADEQAEILAMDWTNIVQALMGAGLIIIRKLDMFKALK